MLYPIPLIMSESSILLAVPSPEEMIRYGGVALICAIVFIETGLLLGLIIPGGDSLLFTSGILVATYILESPVYMLIPLLIISGVAGDLLGYSIGKKLGPRLHNRPDSWIFKRKHLEKAETFYKEKGKMAIVAGKFVPVVRTFNPLLAGVSQMPLSVYIPITAVGTSLWICTLVLAGFYTGKQFPELKNYIHYLVPAIIFISVVPLAINYWRKKKA